MLGRSPASSWLATVLLIVATLVPLADAVAFDRTNLPLKNWGGFSEFRDATYDDLERLVTAGLAHRPLFDTKPLSRNEAGRLVGRGIHPDRKGEGGRLHRPRRTEARVRRPQEEVQVEAGRV